MVEKPLPLQGVNLAVNRIFPEKRILRYNCITKRLLVLMEQTVSQDWGRWGGGGGEGWLELESWSGWEPLELLDRLIWYGRWRILGLDVDGRTYT
jgi:hypothetical protein